MKASLLTCQFSHVLSAILLKRHACFAQGDGILGKLETLVQRDRKPEAPKKSLAEMRADALRQEIARLKNWQLRVVKT